MTNMESLYGSGKFTEIMQSVKLTEIKKISAEEVEFYTSEERFDIHSQLRKFMEGKKYPKGKKNSSSGRSFCRTKFLRAFVAGLIRKNCGYAF